MLTTDQLRNRINYLEEETALDPELAKPEFRVFGELASALAAAESEAKPTPAMRTRPNGYISFLISVAEEYLAPGDH